MSADGAPAVGWDETGPLGACAGGACHWETGLWDVCPAHRQAIRSLTKTPTDHFTLEVNA